MIACAAQGFLEQVAINLDPALQHPDKAMASLRALRALCKVFEYRSLERRQEPVNVILCATFPQLASILEIVLNSNPADDAGAEVLKIGIKTLWSVVHQALPRFLQDEQVFMRWMNILYRALELPVPPALAGPSTYGSFDEERAKSHHWKAKTMTVQVLQRLMSKYGNLKQSERQFNKPERAGELGAASLPACRNQRPRGRLVWRPGACANAPARPPPRAAACARGICEANLRLLRTRVRGVCRDGALAR